VLLIALSLAACSKEAFAPPSARKKPKAAASAPKPAESAPDPSASPGEADEDKPAPDTFPALAAEMAKAVEACQTNYLEKFDYAQLDTGLPPVAVNEFDSACKGPILKLYEKLDAKFAGRSPVADDWLAEVSLLSDQVFMLSGMLKNLGSRRLSALVQRMRAVEKESRATAEKVRTTMPPADDAAWPTYAAALAGTGAPEQAFELVRGRAVALAAWLDERIMAHLKKDEMVYYLSWGQRVKQLRKTVEALPSMDRKAEIDALLGEWAQMEKLLDGDFQDHKEPVQDQAKTLRLATDALSKKK
jgi:hypothetical protein